MHFCSVYGPFRQVANRWKAAAHRIASSAEPLENARETKRIAVEERLQRPGNRLHSGRRPLEIGGIPET
jgi:hypothetical protein